MANDAPDPAFDAALIHASRTNCCGNDTWRGRLCPYHQGFEDGYDAALEAATLDA